MDEPDEIFIPHEVHNRPPDPMQHKARDKVEKYINEHPEKVFFSRQIEVLNETEFFHWVTNRAIRDLEASGKILTEMRQLKTGGTIKLLWHRSYRY
jgi:cysteine synthase